MKDVKIEKLKKCKVCSGSGRLIDGRICPACKGSGYISETKEISISDNVTKKKGGQMLSE